MNAGSRVHTPDGPGVLVRLVVDHRWAFNRPDVITWAAVRLDGKAYPQMFHPAHVKEASMNEPENPTGGVLIQEPENTTEPAPDPDPTEPQPEPADGDDDEEKLVEWP